MYVAFIATFMLLIPDNSKVISKLHLQSKAACVNKHSVELVQCEPLFSSEKGNRTMVKRFAAALLSIVMFSSAVFAEFTPKQGAFVDADDYFANYSNEEMLERITVDGELNLDLAQREFELSSGEEHTFWQIIVAAIIASVKASCENDWSYRDKDRCVGKCEDYKKDKDKR